jgi:hypothetical protein
MITVQWPPLELPLLAYILAANLLTVFIGMVERKILRLPLYNYLYLAIIVSTLLIFFSVLIHSENLEILGIIIVISSYFVVAFIFVFIISFGILTAVKGMCILRKYKRVIREEK